VEKGPVSLRCRSGGDAVTGTVRVWGEKAMRREMPNSAGGKKTKGGRGSHKVCPGAEWGIEGVL